MFDFLQQFLLEFFFSETLQGVPLQVTLNISWECLWDFASGIPLGDASAIYLKVAAGIPLRVSLEILPIVPLGIAAGYI